MKIPADKIIIALDVQDKSEALFLMNELNGLKIWIKVGMEVFYSLGPDIIYEARQRGFNIFLDLKLHDIPNTVGNALKALLKLPIQMINLHAAGGSEMIQRAREEIKKLSPSTFLIAVTQLTSVTREQMNREQKISGEIIDCVAHYALLAKNNGCHGIVCSPHEVEMVKLICGPHFLTITPGIRLPLDEHQDQKRVMTPKEAFSTGADFLVIGRSVTKAKFPRFVLEEILK